MDTLRRLALLGLLLFVAGWSSCGNSPSTPPVQRPPFDGQDAFRILEKQVSFGPRTPGSKAHEQTEAYLFGQLKQTARVAFKQTFTESTSFGGPYPFANLIGLYGPTTGRKLLLCAHWDTRPVADEDPDPANRSKPIAGANDGGSGVAVLLKMAQAFQQTPPPLPVIIALWDAEDSGKLSAGPPLYGFGLGADYFAKHMSAEARPDEVILLDMVGGDSRHNPRVGTRTNIGGNDVFDLPQELTSLQAAPALMNEVYSAAIRLGDAAFQRRPGYSVIDDHTPFIAAGIPAIDIIDFDYPEWHTIDDTPANCDANSLYQVGDALLEVVYARKA